MRRNRFVRFVRGVLNAIRTARGKLHSKLTVDYNGLALHYDTSSPIAKEWFYPRYLDGRNVHEPPIAQLIFENLRPDSVFFDVGANLGFFSVLAANICNGRAGAVHSFEIDPRLAPLIVRSLELNEEAGRASVNCVGCGAPGMAFYEFAEHQQENPSTNQLMAASSSETGTERRRKIRSQVPTVALDDYCREMDVAPDLIKMDIEGAEALAISGMKEILDKERPTLLVEFHPQFIENRFESDTTELVRFIEEAGGYEAQVVDDYRKDREVTLVPFSQVRSKDGKPMVVLFRP